MNALNYLPLPVVRLLAFFHRELSEKRPGRQSQMLQLWVGCLLVTLISMTFEVPFLGISLTVLFYGVQSNAFYTKFVAILFIAATIMEIGFLFMIYKWSYSYPLLRMIIASLIVFGSMFLMRTYKLGLIFFALAIVGIYGQTFPGMIDYPEVVARLTLWCIVVGLYPTLLMVLLGVLWFPSRAGQQIQESLCARLDDALSHLAVPTPALTEKYVEREVLALQKLSAFCMLDDTDWKAHSAWWKNCVATVSYLYTTLNRYSDEAARHQALAYKLQYEITALQSAIAQGEPWQTQWQLSAEDRIIARECGLEGLCERLLQLGHMDPKTPPAPAVKESSMVADAFSNPAYVRYALKTLLACMICYIFYSGADWEGIHTSMLTCIIVANPSIGSTGQKMALRFGGAFIGAALALLMTICIMPWLDNIVELLCVLSPVFLLGAWIATGSERSSYIGTQIIVTFSLATLENVFGPVYDLVEIRDRAVGILIGTAVSAVIFTFIWPESEANTLPRKLASALNMLGKLLRLPQQDPADRQAYLQLRVGCHAAFNACEEMCERVALERQLDDDKREHLLALSRDTLQHGREILYGCDSATAPLPAFAQALEQYAAGLENGEATPVSLSSEISPTLPAQTQRVIQQIVSLPDWTRPATTVAEAQAQGATLQ